MVPWWLSFAHKAHGMVEWNSRHRTGAFYAVPVEHATSRIASSFMQLAEQQIQTIVDIGRVIDRKRAALVLPCQPAG
jgi:hypothetical protein